MKYALFLFLLTTLPGCKNQGAEEGPYGIAPSKYADLATTYLDHWSSYDFEALTAMMSEDAEYYFPDGDENSRTQLIGKQAILEWWNNWESTGEVSSMTFTGRNIIPLLTRETTNTTGMSGHFALIWTTDQMVFANGNSCGVRMNLGLHFNQEDKIDRIWTYYDRTPIIQAMGYNVLKPLEENAEETDSPQ